MRTSGLALSLLLAGCKVGYVVKSAYFQAELLASRRPVADVVDSEPLTEEERAALQTIAEVKAWGAGIGLASTHNYESVAWDWDRTIWNLTACEPLAFEPREWWFPIVGRVPYLGFFREQDARRVEARQRRRGRDVYVRTAGAYSTLGWFKDPVLRPMLQWSAFDLADTVLHELAHATVWIPGSVEFNESFASFVGEEASLRWLSQRYGPGSDPVAAARTMLEDADRWRSLQRNLTDELAAVYANPALGPEEMASRKQALFDSLPARVLAAGFTDPDPYVDAARRGPWNNARLVQFVTYNDARDELSALLARHDGDIVAFMQDVARRTEGAADPYAAIAFESP